MTSTTLTVYSKPSCVQCTATYRALDKAGVPYEVVNIAEDPAARDYAMSLGHMQAPVVVVSGPDGDEHWGGYVPDKIKAFADAYDRAHAAAEALSA